MQAVQEGQDFRAISAVECRRFQVCLCGGSFAESVGFMNTDYSTMDEKRAYCTRSLPLPASTLGYTTACRFQQVLFAQCDKYESSRENRPSYQ